MAKYQQGRATSFPILGAASISGKTAMARFIVRAGRTSTRMTRVSTTVVKCLEEELLISPENAQDVLSLVYDYMTNPQSQAYDIIDVADNGRIRPHLRRVNNIMNFDDHWPCFWNKYSKDLIEVASRFKSFKYS